MKFRQPPRYDLTGSVEIRMNDRRYYAWLDSELVVGEVFARNGKAVLRKVTSRDVETSVLLRASDKAHADDDSYMAAPGPCGK